ncbi:hypothetical protein L6452_37207 [Arctium lappa]|uniref:Uncharacterized protein n=1 Tax=Arctium lappa TaxID=4217 RepID=A0ACB8Y2U9_ARCLA|nr:hypothetical protein L6452_37207 [Arctium lappa]
MWAIRKASFRIKSQPFSSVAFRACYAKSETASSSYMDNTRFVEPPPHTSDRSLLLKRYSSRAHGAQSSFIGKHSFSSQAGTKSSGEEDDDLKYDFSELDATSSLDQGKNVEHESDNELISETGLSESEDEGDDIAVEEPQNELDLSDTEKAAAKSNGRGKRASSGLFKALISSTSTTAKRNLDKWLEEGNDLSRIEISRTMLELRRRRMYGKALQLSEWLESQESVEFGERDYASRVDLIAKIRGLQQAESYIEKIPESFKGEVVYRTLLANCVLSTQTTKAEKVFNKMKDLKLPLTAFACNQLLLLYKRTDKRKIADVLLLMEKENIKPSLFTYRLLIDTKGQSNDISGMEQILETMKSEGLEPDLRLQAVLARQYVHGGLKEKAKMVLNEMEGNNLNENRMACSSLLHIYGLLGSANDVKRVWEVCSPDPRLEECMSAIDAWGKLKKVEEAEAVFDHMSKKWKTLSAKHYTSMLRVYANNKMLSKGQNLVKQMGESGCRIGPFTLDAIVKLYLEAGEIEKADSILKKGSQQIQTKPLFSTYMMVLDQYAKRGDVHNSERMFHRMRQDGYVSRFRQYNSLLQAYINAKIPAYGFRERMKADNVFPTKSLASQLVQVDAFKKTAMSDLLD